MKETFRPVFIGGCDRSGTTMLGDILGAAEGAFATPESQFLHELAPLLHIGAFDSDTAAADWLAGHFRFATWELAGGAQHLASLVDHTDTRTTMEHILQAYLQQNRPEWTNSRVWVDHTPDNFKHYTLLRSLFPDARYIHIVRDGRDVYNSVRNLDWGPNNAYMATRFWSERLQQALAVEISESGNCLRVRYEDILRDPESEIQRICDFAGLDYRPGMIDGGGLILPGFTHSQHQLVGSRPNPSRIDQWRTRVKPHEIQEFESYPWSRVLLQRLGYELETTHPVEVSGLTVMLRYLHDFLRYGINRYRHRNMERNLLHR